MGCDYLGVGIVYGVSILGAREKQIELINDKYCTIFQYVYEYVEKILEQMLLLLKCRMKGTL